MVYREALNCRLCGGALFTRLQLKPTPLANNYTDTPVRQELYPLTLMQCKVCSHVQLREVVSPHVLYSDYRYKSGASRWFTCHMEQLAKQIFEQNPNAFVIEIGSNDGTLLKALERRNMKAIGVDPAGAYRCMKQCFDASLSDTLPMADCIVAINVLAHIDDLHSVFDGVNSMLSRNGIFIVEVQYLRDLVADNRFDMIYHEHLDYHQIKPLSSVLRKHGLFPYKLTFTSNQGGSIRLYCSKTNVYYDPVEIPIDAGLLSVPANPVAGLSGKIAAYGACAKTTGLICQTGASFDVIYDDTPGKIGMYAPTGQRIVQPKDEPADHVYIAAWNYADEIKAKNPDLHYV